MRRAGLYWRTVRHLEPRQIANRLWRSIYRPRVQEVPTPALRRPAGGWCIPARRNPSMADAFTFRFLGQTSRIEPGTWNATERSALWSYNLHYFDDLNAQSADARTNWHRNALSDWIASVPRGESPGWDPYPMSLRIVNWIKWMQSGVKIEPTWVGSLAIQAAALEKRLEYHLGGNHLFANAKALIFAGFFFDGALAGRWMRLGLSIIQRELARQVLSDGGHYERSPMYHALAFEDVLDLINLVSRYEDAVPERSRSFVATWSTIAGKMERALDIMCHPDGDIAFFNDAARGIAPAPAELCRYARDLGTKQVPCVSQGVNRLPETGYLSVKSDELVAIIDAAPVGPDELPGHAHADTLSFELSLGSQRLFVNGGTSTYEVGEVRQRERGTASHTTVTINGEDSSEVWASFRVARRARVFNVEVSDSVGEVHVAASHDGYTRLPGRPVHRRSWNLRPGQLVVDDLISGRFDSAVARFHLQPAVQCVIDETACAGWLTLPTGRRVRWQSNAPGGLEVSHYSPCFGVREATGCLAFSMRKQEHLRFELNW